jgi:hypothetical protein
LEEDAKGSGRQKGASSQGIQRRLEEMVDELKESHNPSLEPIGESASTFASGSILSYHDKNYERQAG